MRFFHDLEQTPPEAYPPRGAFGARTQVDRSSAGYVKWVQRSLNKLMGLRLAVDGIMGPLTRSAVRSFQQKARLSVDGIVGPRTESALKAALGSAVSTATSSAAGSASTDVCRVMDDFEFDHDQLKPDHLKELERVADIIINSWNSPGPIRMVRLTGHTDPVGSPTYNLALGKRRARHVAGELTRRLESKQRGSSRQLTMIVDSRGEQQPVSNDPAHNRRVEICWRPPQTLICKAPPETRIRPTLRWQSRFRVPKFRPCCMLAPPFADPANLGLHRHSSEALGIVYTGRAGFLDLAHIRDSCDMTKYIHDQLTLKPGYCPSKVFADYGHGHLVEDRAGEAKMYGCAPRPMDVARGIAYAVGLGHEIMSYWFTNARGGHNSSFSPEDLCSNFLGTLLAEQAVAAGGDFDTAVTTKLNAMIQSLDGQTLTESRKAFNLIHGRWVQGQPSHGIKANSGYLVRRNFTRRPWKAGHSSDKPTPGFVTAMFLNSGTTFSFFSYLHTHLGVRYPDYDYHHDIACIKQDARRKYGPDFDRP